MVEFRISNNLKIITNNHRKKKRHCIVLVIYARSKEWGFNPSVKVQYSLDTGTGDGISTARDRELVTTDAADPITAVTASGRSVQLPLVHPTLPSLPTSTRSDLLVLSSSSRWFLVQSAGAGIHSPRVCLHGNPGRRV